MGVLQQEAVDRDVMRYSSTNYHQAYVLRTTTEQHRLYKNDEVPFVAIILRFHGVSNLKEVLEPRFSGQVLLRRAQFTSTSRRKPEITHCRKYEHVFWGAAVILQSYLWKELIMTGETLKFDNKRRPRWRKHMNYLNIICHSSQR